MKRTVERGTEPAEELATKFNDDFVAVTLAIVVAIIVRREIERSNTDTSDKADRQRVQHRTTDRWRIVRVGLGQINWVVQGR